MNFRDKSYDVFNMFDKQWALATAWTLEDFDGCTIGYGLGNSRQLKASLTFICHKIYWEQFDPEHIDSEIFSKVYANNRPTHYEFIGEIVEALDRR